MRFNRYSSLAVSRDDDADKKANSLATAEEDAALCALIVCGSLSSVAHAQSLDSLRHEFADPPKAMRPMMRWWWPGGDVTADELRREVRVLDDAGFGGAEIQAFRIGLKTDVPADVAARVNDYPTPSFYRKVQG